MRQFQPPEPAGLAFSNFVKRQKDASDSAAAAPSGMDLGRLLRSGLYVPLSEALLMFYQVCPNSILLAR